MLLKEEQHLFQALKKCKYPTWALNRVKMRCQNPSNKRRTKNNSQKNNNSKRYLYMVVPYYQGLSESMKRSCKKYRVQVHFKGGLTIKNLLMAPKDKDHILKKSGVIYRYSCDRVECDEEYIGESARTFAERFKKHQKAPSSIYDYSNRSGHEVNIDNFSIVGREDHNLIRTIKEAYIRVNNPSLNKNIGKYHLPHIWDEVLFNRLTTYGYNIWPGIHPGRLFHLPPWQITSANHIILTNGNTISHSGNNICHKIQQHTSMAITSAINDTSFPQVATTTATVAITSATNLVTYHLWQ